MNYRHTPQDYQVLLDMGIPSEDISSFEVIPIDQYCIREHYRNRLEEGYEVPEEHIPIPKPRAQKEHDYREMLLRKVEDERNKIPEMFPDPYDRHYEDDEIVFDDDVRDFVPEHVYNKRREEVRQENLALRKQKHYGKVSRNAEISKKLLEVMKKNGIAS
jgi:hypothetical protein